MGGYGWFEVGMGGNGWLQVVKSGYEWFGLPEHRLYSTICPRYVQCMPEICATFAQGMGIQIERSGTKCPNNFPIAGEKVGHFVVWDNLSREKCQWDILSLGQKVS